MRSVPSTRIEPELCLATTRIYRSTMGDNPRLKKCSGGVEFDTAVDKDQAVFPVLFPLDLIVV